ncbi:hypothetical protein BDR06DRAFT_1015349 [Suillus hirtellus]|nr:hypothetical protein BDR06DRAFT_1015349 [Suillus hirtellus]
MARHHLDRRVSKSTSHTPLKLALHVLLSQANPGTSVMKIAIRDQLHIHTPYVIDRGYRFPEPALLISPKLPEHLQIYLANWLASCAMWVGRVDHDPPHTYPTPQLWCDFLGSVPSAQPQSHQEKAPDRKGLTAMEKQKQVM